MILIINTIRYQSISETNVFGFLSFQSKHEHPIITELLMFLFLTLLLLSPASDSSFVNARRKVMRMKLMVSNKRKKEIDLVTLGKQNTNFCELTVKSFEQMTSGEHLAYKTIVINWMLPGKCSQPPPYYGTLFHTSL